MPSLNQYKKMLGSHTNGEARKIQSDDIILNSWNEDIQSKVSHISYIYDYYHDDEPLVLKGMHPEKSKTKCPIDLKFIVDSYNSEAKDIVGSHIQFKPRWDWHNERKLSYYKEVFEDKYSAEFPLALYLDIWDDEIEMYRKWLITEYANTLGNQFPTWYVLPCDHIFQWVANNKKYQMCGCTRSQNSYILCASYGKPYVESSLIAGNSLRRQSATKPLMRKVQRPVVRRRTSVRNGNHLST